jgi:type VI protein secretion system component VasK
VWPPPFVRWVEFGAWIPPISFRIRESAEDFDETLQVASFSGETYEVTREDGLKDEIYLLPGQRPLWVKEPTGRWRIFKYYSGEEISNYAHSFYARLGMNVFLYALLN